MTTATKKTETATFGWDGSWWVVVYRGDKLVARSRDYSERLAAEIWLVTNYPEAKVQ